MSLGLCSETDCSLVTGQLNVPEFHEQQQQRPSSFHRFVFSMDRKKQLTAATTQRLIICLFDLDEHLYT